MTLYEVAPAGYVPIADAAAAVKRSKRTIYEWVQLEGIRTFKPTNEPALVHLQDVFRVDAIRQQGRRRKPRLPRL